MITTQMIIIEQWTDRINAPNYKTVKLLNYITMTMTQYEYQK